MGPATYFMTRTGRWAVSNVGLPSDSPDQDFTSFSSSQFINTLDSELFQTARISAGSLRYYGLGLENGNYTVNLQFAESQILNPPTWRSLGRRVFDVYVQVCTIFFYIYIYFLDNHQLDRFTIGREKKISSLR